MPPSPHQGNLRPHPLAQALIERLHGAGFRILEIGTGSLRNRAALEAAGHAVDSFAQAPEAPAVYDGAISTHALLHGTRDAVAGELRRIARVLRPGAPFYATFASVRDERFGKGIQIDPYAFAPSTGDEAGVAHAFFDEPALRAAVEPLFSIESVDERNVDAVVGRWAHAQPPRGSVHFFLVARNRGIDA